MLGTPPQYWYSGSYDAFGRDLAVATECSAAAELEEAQLDPLVAASDPEQLGAQGVH